MRGTPPAHAVALLALGLALGPTLAACPDDGGTTTTDGPVSPAPDGAPWKTLAEWHLFEDAPKQVPNDGVYPYAVTSPLFSDYAAKHRFFWLPDGQKIGYRGDKVWDLPVGAIVVKTFAYPIDERDASKGEHILETRLLVHEAGGWVPHTYVWNEAQTEALIESAGDFIQASWIDADGVTQSHRYVVPNTNECQDCHAKAPATQLLGVKTGQLGAQRIDELAAAGLFATAPPAAASRLSYAAPDDETAPLVDRARAYFDANCQHCHNPEGDAKAKALYLDWAHTDPVGNDPSNWGACKIPTSAGGATCGYTFDVVPGDSAHSIMICRMLSTVSADQMPPLGRSIVHAEGVALIQRWIDAMEPDDCQ